MAKFAIIVLRTSLMGKDPQHIHRINKTRWEIGQLFKLLCDTFGKDASDIGDDAGF
ncbi:MAG: hypothetical protein FWG10_01320 [Eubacteriaceae bacterium]|nr:hypothetical protein [Eubacteriaceae bacterium]